MKKHTKLFILRSHQWEAHWFARGWPTALHTETLILRFLFSPASCGGSCRLSLDPTTEETLSNPRAHHHNTGKFPAILRKTAKFLGPACGTKDSSAKPPRKFATLSGLYHFPCHYIFCRDFTKTFPQFPSPSIVFFNSDWFDCCFQSDAVDRRGIKCLKGHGCHLEYGMEVTSWRKQYQYAHASLYGFAVGMGKNCWPLRVGSQGNEHSIFCRWRPCSLGCGDSPNTNTTFTHDMF